MKILFITHWFPPYNAIGSVRAFEMARYLVSIGHQVTVITTINEGIPTDYDADTDCFQVIREPLPVILRFTQGSHDGITGLVRRIVKRIFYPDQYILLRRRLVAAAIKANSADMGHNLVVSTALPFSINVVARDISSKLGIPWISDNRDIWANTPYRRSIFFSQYVDLMYERIILSSARYCISIGRGMTQVMTTRLKKSLVFTIMNGADCVSRSVTFIDYSKNHNTWFSYTGSLYKGERDVGPLINALSKLPYQTQLNFHGSESTLISKMKIENPLVDIRDLGHVSKTEVKAIQENAHFLVLALGSGEFEKTVLTGKFFEYIERCRPIIAICDPDSEVGLLVSNWNLGCATRDPDVIQKFIDSVLESGKWSGKVPIELTRTYQLNLVFPKLLSEIEKSL